MKKIVEFFKNNTKTIIGILFEIVGVLFWAIGLTAQAGNNILFYLFVNIGFCLVGSILIKLSMKINPERIHRLLADDVHINSTTINIQSAQAVNIEICEPLSDWDRCYLIALRSQKESENE